MASIPPRELLLLWQHERITPEMALGHLCQNLLKHEAMLETLTAALGVLRTQLESHISASHPDTSSPAQRSKRPLKRT